jgi:4-aminobutyrate aminotransferase-like enzyme
MHKLAKLDQRYIWHPFTQMRDWAKQEPIVLERGKGAVLEDVRGKRSLDGNSSNTAPFPRSSTIGSCFAQSRICVKGCQMYR